MFLRLTLNAMRSGLPSLDQHKDWDTSTTVVLFLFLGYYFISVLQWVGDLYPLFVDISFVC